MTEAKEDYGGRADEREGAHRGGVRALWDTVCAAALRLKMLTRPTAETLEESSGRDR